MPITTDSASGATEFAKKDASGIETAAQPNKAIEVGGAPKSVAGNDQKVTVKPLRTFLDSETGNHVTPASDAFEVTRHHAVQLRTNGLVEFESDQDESDAVADQVKANKTRIADRAKAGELPANSKTTPLKNPKLNY